MFSILFDKFNRFYERVFSAYGRFRSKFYMAIRMVVFGINAFLTCGILRMKMITDSDELYMPVDSLAKKHESDVKRIFEKSTNVAENFFLHQQLDLGTWAEVNFRSCQARPWNLVPEVLSTHDLQVNILTRDFIKRIAGVNEYILNKTVVHVNSTHTITFNDVCAKRNGKCLIDGADLLDEEFYVDWLNDAMNSKTRSENEQAYFNDLGLEAKDESNEATGSGSEASSSSATSSNPFRFYIKLKPDDTGLTDLTYNLGKNFRINSYAKSRNGTVPAYANMFKLRYNLKSNFENVDEKVKLWELEFLKTLKHLTTSTTAEDLDFCNPDQSKVSSPSSMYLVYGASQSLDAEMEANLSLDTKLVSGTFCLIIFLAILLMSLNTTWVTSPGFILPFSGILSATFGILSSFGMLSYFNYPACQLIFVIPFLVIGIGIDDMFIIYAAFLNVTHALKTGKYGTPEASNGHDNASSGEMTGQTSHRNSDKRKSEENKQIMLLISETLRKSGVSITVTSLTDFVAFVVGISTGFKSVQIFCVYAGVAIAMCYFYQLTFFTGFLVLHAKRVQKKHNAILFCFKQSTLRRIFGYQPKPKAPEKQNGHATQPVELNDMNNNIESIEAVGSTSKEANSSERQINKQAFVYKLQKMTESWCKKFFRFTICTKAGRIVACLVFVIYIVLSAFSAYQIKEGINLADLVSHDSYYNSYLTENMASIELNPIVMFVINEPIDYDNANVRKKINDVVQSAQSIEGINSNFHLSWLSSFEQRKIKYKTNLNNLYERMKALPPLMNDVIIQGSVLVPGDENDYGSSVGDSSTQNQTAKLKKQILFKESLALIAKNRPEYLNNKKAKNNLTFEIVASRFYLQYARLKFSSLDAKPMNLLRDLCEESGLPIIPYAVPFKFYEQFEQTFPNIIQAFVIALEAMYLIAILFIPDLVTVFCIIASMLSIMTGLIGCMNIWGLTLSSVTMIELIMSVGFCVDFSAHVAHAFIASVGKGSRSERAYKACIRVGFPIFNSALSTIIGISLLGFCRSYIFVSFFKTLIILMILGVLNSLIFLPVLLALVGPNWRMHKYDLKGAQGVNGNAPQPTSSQNAEERLARSSTVSKAPEINLNGLPMDESQPLNPESNKMTV